MRDEIGIQLKAVADAKAAALAKDVKEKEVLVARAQSDLEASINVRHFTKLSSIIVFNESYS